MLALLTILLAVFCTAYACNPFIFYAPFRQRYPPLARFDYLASPTLFFTLVFLLGSGRSCTHSEEQYQFSFLLLASPRKAAYIPHDREIRRGECYVDHGDGVWGLIHPPCTKLSRNCRDIYNTPCSQTDLSIYAVR
jgi:hypothetical protein